MPLLEQNRTEQKFISLLITNDTRNILSLSQKSEFATGSCEGTSGLRVEQQPYINKFTRKTKTKSILMFNVTGKSSGLEA